MIDRSVLVQLTPPRIEQLLAAVFSAIELWPGVGAELT